MEQAAAAAAVDTYISLSPRSGGRGRARAGSVAAASPLVSFVVCVPLNAVGRSEDCGLRHQEICPGLRES